MLPRYIIRNHGDAGHVYCAVEQSNTHKIVRVEISDDNSGRVETKDIYILVNGMIAGLECDPENPKYVFLVDDY